MTQETEALLHDVLTEKLKQLSRDNENAKIEELNRRLDDIDRRRWGYPSLRSQQGRRR